MAPSRDIVDIASQAAAISPDPITHPHEAHANGANGHTDGMANGRSAEANGIDAEGKPHNWIPIAEHVLWKPTRKVRMISIGCGFSGTLAPAFGCGVNG